MSDNEFFRNHFQPCRSGLHDVRGRERTIVGTVVGDERQSVRN